jgi:hypothetical protein
MATNRRTRRPSLPGETLVELYLAAARDFDRCLRRGLRGQAQAHERHRQRPRGNHCGNGGAARGTTAQYWLNLQNAVDLLNPRWLPYRGGCGSTVRLESERLCRCGLGFASYRLDPELS